MSFSDFGNASDCVIDSGVTRLSSLSAVSDFHIRLNELLMKIDLH